MIQFIKGMETFAWSNIDYNSTYKKEKLHISKKRTTPILSQCQLLA